jgi:predicted thioesterase
MGIEVGHRAQQQFTVTDADTARAVGSGSLPVLGTPRLLAWCEAVTCAAIEGVLDDGQTSVGARILLEHRAPSPVDARVDVTAEVAHVDGRRVVFDVRAAHPDGALVGIGEITRALVDADRFVARLG